MAELTRVALEDSFRIFVAQLDRSFLFSRAAFAETPPVDPEAGIGWWFWRGALTAKPAGEPLRVGLVSRAQTVFAATWNPVGLYNLYAPIAWPVLESTVEPGPWNVTDPVTGESSWLCAEVAGIESGEDAAARGDFSATVAVPASALRWDGAAHAWRPVGAGLVSRGKVVLDYGGLRWHNGLDGAAADVLHWLAFRLDWSREDGPGDVRFDQNVRDVHGFDLERTLAVEVLSPTRLSVYTDWGWAMAPERLARLSAHAPAFCHWTVIQAAEALALAGEEPGKRYAFETDGDAVPLDALEPGCVAALREKLVSLRDSGTVPAGIAGLVTAEEAAAAYSASIAFIDAHGHAWISDGPYVLDKVSFDPSYFELARYPEYRADNAETAERLSRTIASIDGMSCPAMARKGEDIVVEIGRASCRERV